MDAACSPSRRPPLAPWSRPDPTDRLASLTAGLVSQDISAALLGGYGGAWRHWHEVAAVPLSELDSAISAGIVITLAARELAG